MLRAIPGRCASSIESRVPGFLPALSSVTPWTERADASGWLAPPNWIGDRAASVRDRCNGWLAAPARVLHPEADMGRVGVDAMRCWDCVVTVACAGALGLGCAPHPEEGTVVDAAPGI